MNLDWMKQLPPQLVQFLEQLLPLPTVVRKYKEEVRRLDMEVLVLGNLLIEKKILTKEELKTMTEKIMNEKKEQYSEDDKIEKKITKREQIEQTKKIQEAINFRAEYNKKIKQENEVVKKSARLAPRGHGI